jgi:16S rRNA processing protein RimM
MSKKIGKIIGTHGLHGDVRIVHEVKPGQDMSAWDCFQLELLPGSRIPFFIKEIEEIQEGEWICTFEGIQSKEAAQQLVNKAVFESINFSVTLVGEENWSQIMGFAVWNETEYVGRITGVVDLSQNVLFEVEGDGKEHLIPAVAEFILDIQADQQKIIMQLPEGLLDL